VAGVVFIFRTASDATEAPAVSRIAPSLINPARHLRVMGVMGSA